MKKLLSLFVLALLIPQLAFGFGLQGYVGDSENFPHGITYLALFDDAEEDADYSVGSPTSTYSSSRSASNPHTYPDENGDLQLVTTSNIGVFPFGFWDETGFHLYTHRAIKAESPSTNYLRDSMFGRAIGSDDWTSDWATITDTDAEIINISGAKERNLAYTFDGTEGSYTKVLEILTATDSFDSSGGDIEGVLSFWAKGDISGITTGTSTTKFLIVDNYTNESSRVSNSISITLDVASGFLSTTQWRRLSFPFTTSGVTTRKVKFLFMALSSTNKPTNGENFDITITGVQIEKSTSATSFIPTTTAALTRNVEENKYETAGNRTKAGETMVAKIAVSFTDTAFHIIDSTDTIKRYSGSTSLRFFYPNSADSGDCLAIGGAKPVLNTETTFGWSCQHSSPYAELFMDGVSIDAETVEDFIDPDWGTYFWVGSRSTGGQQLDGVILGIGFWGRKLSDAEILFLHEKDWRTLR